MKKIRTCLWIMVLAGIYSCGSDDRPPSPVATQLIFPEENSECTAGVDVSATQSRIDFSWEAAANTDTYRLSVNGLLTGDSDTYTTASTSFEVTLQKGEPYSWSVTSISDNSSQTATSETWNFYNAGDGVESYAPFPARVVTPEMGATVLASGGTLTLQWEGADVDNDISGYNVYLDTSDPPVTLIGTFVGSVSFQANGLTSDTIYYWRIVTVDAEGNSSDSEVFQFRTLN